MIVKYFISTLLCLSCIHQTTAQTKKLKDWDATAFCSYTRYHPFNYINADNNWEILQALQIPATREQLDSLGIKTTDSQMMLLRIEGLLELQEEGRWKSLLPLLDSIQTVKTRTYSLEIATGIYSKIKTDCSTFVKSLQKQNLGENAYSILFSYILDGIAWEKLNSFEDLKNAATWSGECWAFYYHRTFSCGTNTYYKEFNVNWTRNQPEFINKELNTQTFIKPLIDEYDQQGKITSDELFNKALSLGIVHNDGTLRIPVINSKDKTSEFNRYADKITDTIVHHLKDSDIIPHFQQQFNISNEKLACTILYHEIIWDLMDLLTKDEIVTLPSVWVTGDKKMTYAITFIEKK